VTGWFNIKTKLFIVLISVSMIPLVLMGWISLEESRSAISNDVFNHLISVRDGKKAQLDRYFDNIQSDIKVLAKSPNIDIALDAFTSVVQNGEVDQAQYNFFESLEYGPSFHQFINEYGYYDLMLITDQGDIVYTTKRENDFSQNILNGPLKDSLLGKSFEQGLKEVVLTDYEIYDPVKGQVLSFLIAPIDVDGVTIGAVALKVTNNALNAIMLERSGMGETGEAYLVGPDNLMRSNSFLDTTNRSVSASFQFPQKGSVDTLASQFALAGMKGHQIITDYRGVSVLSAYLPIRIGHSVFALMAEIDEFEAFKSIDYLQRLVLMIAATAAVLMLISTYFIANIITRPIRSLTRSSIDIADGNLDRDITIERNDELGVLSDNFSLMRLSIRSKIQEAEDSKNELRRTNESLEERVEERTSELEEALGLAKQATEAKGEFLASMSHEIRTPMNGVVGMADLLSQTDLTDDQRQMLNTVRDSGNSLLTIINDILDFSKIEAGKLDIETIPFSMSDVLEGAAATISPTASQKNIHIITYVDPDIPEYLLGDPVRLRQIIFNLTGNAVKFSEEGEVIVRADIAETGKDGLKIKISVVDNGIGISEEAQNNLFEAFSQADNSTTRRFGGTGLGLTICKGLVDMMDGEISVESQIGSGSTFAVEVCLSPSGEKASKHNGIHLEDVSFLFITGSDVLGFVVNQYLRHWGATVEVVSNEAEARTKISSFQNQGKSFDIIGIDFNLGDDRQQAITVEFKSDKIRFLTMSNGQRRSARIQGPDIISLDGNPLRQSQLINAVAVAVGRASPFVKLVAEDTTNVKVSALPVEEALAQGTLILLAEDNLTNQNVIQRQLNMLGYTCEIADDGKLALEAWRGREYGLLLTDCHMPNMDGFELTTAIRKDEEGTDSRHPIIAVTANALEGEAQRCIAGGMDDYLSKPLAMNDLKAMLTKWMPLPENDTHEMEQAPTIEDSQIEITDTEKADTNINTAIDPSALKSVFGDDEETFIEILKDFIDPSTSNVEEIEAAFNEHSCQGVATAAHKLKSSARSVGANELADLCQSLEAAGKSENWDEIAKGAPQLSDTFQKVINYIDAL